MKKYISLIIPLFLLSSCNKNNDNVLNFANKYLDNNAYINFYKGSYVFKYEYQYLNTYNEKLYSDYYIEGYIELDNYNEIKQLEYFYVNKSKRISFNILYDSINLTYQMENSFHKLRVNLNIKNKLLFKYYNYRVFPTYLNLPNGEYYNYIVDDDLNKLSIKSKDNFSFNKLDNSFATTITVNNKLLNELSFTNIDNYFNFSIEKLFLKRVERKKVEVERFKINENYENVINFYDEIKLFDELENKYKL